LKIYNQRLFVSNNAFKKYVIKSYLNFLQSKNYVMVAEAEKN